jgi:FXSXX-COOH protein
MRMNSLAASLGTIGTARLDSLSASKVAKVVRRVVDNEAVAPKLDVAAFNSAI